MTYDNIERHKKPGNQDFPVYLEDIFLEEPQEQGINLRVKKRRFLFVKSW